MQCSAAATATVRRFVLPTGALTARSPLTPCSVLCRCLFAAVVDVMQLPPADLAKLRTSLTEDVQTITQNYGNLKASSAAPPRATANALLMMLQAP